MGQLTPTLILGLIAAYFAVLIVISMITGKNADNADFFISGKQSPWILVAIGMVGASLSGVTFISIPGVVGKVGKNMSFSYMQMVFGYLVGYFVIATVLMPLYYRLNLTSIYGYLEKRLGFYSYKTGAGFFLLSRLIGASFRLYLVAMVVQKFVMEPFGVPFWGTVMMTIILIWVYTYKGGIKTIVWTDTLQTIAMLTAVTLTIYSIVHSLGGSLSGIYGMIKESGYAQMFFFKGGWDDPNNFFKQFISGILIAIVMTGLDQDMMQKNLSCKTLKSAQKNMFTFSIVLVFANILFLSLGALLYIFAAKNGIEIPQKTDQLYPIIAIQYLSPAIGITFVIGLVAAAYSSADSALTALTTSFCIDFLNFEKSKKTEQEKKKERLIVHIGFSVALLLVILGFASINNDAVITQLFIAAGYTYGPILGMFAFGIFTKRKINDNMVIPVVLAAPIISFFLNKYSDVLFGGFQFGFLIVALNGLLTFIGLMMISTSGKDLEKGGASKEISVG